MNQYLVRHSNLVLASKSKEEERERTDYEREYSDVDRGLQVSQRAIALRTVPVQVFTEVQDSRHVRHAYTTFCRQNFFDNQNSLFEYLQSLLQFNLWQRVTVVATDFEGNSGRTQNLFEFGKDSLESAQKKFAFFFEVDILWIDTFPAMLQEAMDGNVDRLPPFNWTFKISSKEGGAGSAFLGKRSRQEETNP
jgi:hypothetical protein